MDEGRARVLMATPPVPSSTAGATPVAPSARIGTLDVLRGIALLGMILAHVYKTMAAAPAAGGEGSWLEDLIVWGVAEKDRAVFAFLFGVGFALMLRQLEARGTPILALYLRRLGVLYAIGLAVDVFTRFSILREYAWWAVPLLFIRRLPTRSLLALAVISAAAFSIRELADTGIAVATHGHEATVAAERAQIAAGRQWLEYRAERQEAGSYAQAVATRWHDIVHGIPLFERITPDVYLALFILGLLAVRYRIFDAPWEHRRLLVGAMVAGVAAWGAYWLVLPQLPAEFPTPRLAERLRTGLGLLDEQYLAFTCIGGVTLALAWRPALGGLLAPFAWAGRMALTNYIVHAALLDFASMRYGLGLKLSPGEQWGVGLALFLGLALLSRAWLARFRFGPMEWVWRSLTYWRPQPMRLAPVKSG